MVLLAVSRRRLSASVRVRRWLATTDDNDDDNDDDDDDDDDYGDDDDDDEELNGANDDEERLKNALLSLLLFALEAATSTRGWSNEKVLVLVEMGASKGKDTHVAKGDS